MVPAASAAAILAALAASTVGSGLEGAALAAAGGVERVVVGAGLGDVEQDARMIEARTRPMPAGRRLRHARSWRGTFPSATPSGTGLRPRSGIRLRSHHRRSISGALARGPAGSAPRVPPPSLNAA